MWSLKKCCAFVCQIHFLLIHTSLELVQRSWHLLLGTPLHFNSPSVRAGGNIGGKCCHGGTPAPPARAWRAACGCSMITCQSHCSKGKRDGKRMGLFVQRPASKRCGFGGWTSKCQPFLSKSSSSQVPPPSNPKAADHRRLPPGMGGGILSSRKGPTGLCLLRPLGDLTAD